MFLTQQPQNIPLQSIQGHSTLQTPAGINPVNMFSYKTRILREVGSPISVGTVPIKRLLSSHSQCKPTQAGKPTNFRRNRARQLMVVVEPQCFQSWEKTNFCRD